MSADGLPASDSRPQDPVGACASTGTAAYNTAWGQLFAEELVRLGVRHCCIAPGSRSTPLVVAIARHPGLRSHVVSDERGAAFVALGIGRATGQPAVLVTTSGSAMGHALPAVLEAEADGVPLLLVSADRPPELRATGANQTLDQVHLFGSHVRWQADLPCPEPQLPASMLLTTLDQAVYRCLGPPAGAVHLNMMFREPLGPVPLEPAGLAALAPGLDRWLTASAPWSRYLGHRAVPGPDAVVALAELALAARRGLLVIGGLATGAEQDAARTLAAWLGWPVFADVTSGMRGDDTLPGLVPLFDQLLLSPVLRQQLAPDTVVQVGGAVVSKRLLQWLAAAPPVAQAVVRADAERRDPLHNVSLRLSCSLIELASALPPLPARAATDRHRLRVASDLAEAVLDEALAAVAQLTEIATARTLARHLPVDHGLCTASSMPIRDLDMYAPGSGGARTVFANRGASGIDGLLATAIGCALGSGRPVALLIGDQALLHDIGSLAVLAATRAPVTVVVVDNGGGGIFSFLDVARETDVFERHFAAPHTTEFAAVCRAFAVPHSRVDTVAGLIAALDSAWADPQPSVVEVRTERAANHALHMDIQARIRTRVEAAWTG